MDDFDVAAVQNVWLSPTILQRRVGADAEAAAAYYRRRAPVLREARAVEARWLDPHEPHRPSSSRTTIVHLDRMPQLAEWLPPPVTVMCYTFIPGDMLEQRKAAAAPVVAVDAAAAAADADHNAHDRHDATAAAHAGTTGGRQTSGRTCWVRTDARWGGFAPSWGVRTPGSVPPGAPLRRDVALLVPGEPAESQFDVPAMDTARLRQLALRNVVAFGARERVRAYPVEVNAPQVASPAVQLAGLALTCPGLHQLGCPPARLAAQAHPINFWEQTVRCFHCGRDRFHVQASCSCHGGRVMHDSCLPPELLRLAENESLSKASRPLKEMTCFCTMALQKGTHRCADFDSTRPRLTRPVSTRLDSTRLDPRLVPASSCLQASRCVCRSGGLESNAFIAATLAALHRRTDRPVKSILEWHSQRFPDRCPHM